LDVAKKKMDLADASVAVEHALEEMYMYLSTMDEIKKSHSIPDNFDEADFIEAEIRENIQTAFQHALRDVIMAGRVNFGTCEYLEQFGITSMAAMSEAAIFLKNCSPEDIDGMYKWYDQMANKYRGQFDKAMQRLGIKNIITEKCAYLEEDDD
jgi:hypothetical protein